MTEGPQPPEKGAPGRPPQDGSQDGSQDASQDAPGSADPGAPAPDQNPDQPPEQNPEQAPGRTSDHMAVPRAGEPAHVQAGGPLPHDQDSPRAAAPARLKVSRKMLEGLVCPATQAPLDYDRAAQELISRKARLAYPIRDGIPIMLVAEARQLED